MIKEIELIVCDKCDSVMQAAGEVYMCINCNTPMKRVKFVRQPTKRAADGAKAWVCPSCKFKNNGNNQKCLGCGSPRR